MKLRDQLEAACALRLYVAVYTLQSPSHYFLTTHVSLYCRVCAQDASTKDGDDGKRS